jgi:LysM repeat protein
LVLNSPQLDFTVYEVKQGDNLSLIARRTRTGITDLIRLNKLESPDKLQIGQKIRIR